MPLRYFQNSFAIQLAIIETFFKYSTNDWMLVNLYEKTRQSES